MNIIVVIMVVICFEMVDVIIVIFYVVVVLIIVGMVIVLCVGSMFCEDGIVWMILIDQQLILVIIDFGVILIEGFVDEVFVIVNGVNVVLVVVIIVVIILWVFVVVFVIGVVIVVVWNFLCGWFFICGNVWVFNVIGWMLVGVLVLIVIFEMMGCNGVMIVFGFGDGELVYLIEFWMIVLFFVVGVIVGLIVVVFCCGICLQNEKIVFEKEMEGFV